LAVVSVEDPFSGDAAYLDRTGNLDAAAKLEPVRHADGTMAEGAPAWAPPSRSRVTAVRNLRGDTIGRMHARHQVDETQYNAARAYQKLVEQSTGTLRSLDPGKPVIDYAPHADPLPPFRIAAAKKLREVEAKLKDGYGTAGLNLLRLALTEGNAIEAVARTFGARAEHEIRAVTWLFRRCLNHLALVLNLASSTRRLYRPNRGYGAERSPADDPARHAVDGELSDPALRRGRANGGA
jgi:hypothetical protein